MVKSELHLCGQRARQDTLCSQLKIYRNQCLFFHRQERRKLAIKHVFINGAVKSFSLHPSKNRFVHNSLYNSLHNSLHNSLQNSFHNSFHNSSYNSLQNSLQNSSQNSLYNSLQNSLQNSLHNSLQNLLKIADFNGKFCCMNRNFIDRMPNSLYVCLFIYYTPTHATWNFFMF